MSNIIDTLKNEVLRLARKEAEGQIAKAQKVAKEYRHEVAHLKRLLHRKERELTRLRKQRTPAEEDPLAGTRFSSRSVRAQRQRLGLSAEDYGRLIGVSPLSIYAWEQGKARPRKTQLARLVAVRGIGKKAALAKLADLEKTKKRR